MCRCHHSDARRDSTCAQITHLVRARQGTAVVAAAADVLGLAAGVRRPETARALALKAEALLFLGTAAAGNISSKQQENDHGMLDQTILSFLPMSHEDKSTKKYTKTHNGLSPLSCQPRSSASTPQCMDAKGHGTYQNIGLHAQGLQILQHYMESRGIVTSKRPAWQTWESARRGE